MMPLAETGALGATGSLLAALALGFAFGWCLERGGLGSARKLAGQFYFTDLTVFKVMFSALLTAMLGAFWLDRLGVLDLASRLSAGNVRAAAGDRRGAVRRRVPDRGPVSGHVVRRRGSRAGATAWRSLAGCCSACCSSTSGIRGSKVSTTAPPWARSR